MVLDWGGDNDITIVIGQNCGDVNMLVIAITKSIFLLNYEPVLF